MNVTVSRLQAVLAAQARDREPARSPLEQAFAAVVSDVVAASSRGLFETAVRTVAALPKLTDIVEKKGPGWTFND